MKSCLALLCTVCLLAACARLPEPALAPITSGTAHLTKSPKTWKAVREQHVVMQQFDYSCGAAAMATLMQYYFGDKVTEREILLDIVDHLNKTDFASRKAEGLSLLDLKAFAERRGYQAAGVKLNLTALPQLRGPVLVYLEPPDNRHFAIFRGVREDRVFLADPSRGNLRMRVADFANEWPGIALVLGKAGFGAPSEYPLAIDEEAPLRPELQAARRALYRRF